MNRDQKAAVVDQISQEIESAEAIFAVDYRGLSVSQAADLRAKLREADAKFRIVKNSLTERAADKAGAESLKPLLEGPTALALIRGDAAIAAKALNDAARALQILEFKGGLMNGDTLTADDIRSIARLPARDMLHAQLVGTVAAPLTSLVRGLNSLIAGLAVQLQQIADQGLVSGEPPAAEAAPETEAAPEPKAEAAAEATEVEPEAQSEPAPQAAAEPEPETEQPEQEAAPDAEQSDAQEEQT